MNTDTPRTDAVPKRYMTVVYEIVDETEWRKTNPLKYAHNGLSAVTVSAYDAIELLDEAEAEVERLKKELDAWDYGTRAQREQKRAEKAEAEVERLAEKLTITEDELADAREWLDERYKATSEADERAEKAESEVARLRELLNRAIEIANNLEFWNYSGNGDRWMKALRQLAELKDELAALATAPEEACKHETQNLMLLGSHWHWCSRCGAAQRLVEGKPFGNWQVPDKNAPEGIRFRTRRPLPKQEEERPLLEVMEYCRKWADEHLSDLDRDPFYARLGLLVDFATDFYSDEIEQLKKNQK